MFLAGQYIKYLARHGTSTVVMKSLRGNRLNILLHQPVATTLKKYSNMEGKQFKRVTKANISS